MLFLSVASGSDKKCCGGRTAPVIYWLKSTIWSAVWCDNKARSRCRQCGTVLQEEMVDAYL